MWISAIGGAIALGALLLVWLAYDRPLRGTFQLVGWPLAAQASTLLVLARLHRPSARGQRGIELVFE